MTTAAVRPAAVAGARKAASTEARSLSVSVRRGAAWSMASTMLLKLSSIAITAVVAHILSEHDFGVFAVANTVFTIVSAFAEFGIASCIARADLSVSLLAPTMWTVSLTSSTVFGGALVLFAHPIAVALGAADATGTVRTMAIILVLTGVSAVPTAECIRDFKQGAIFLANVLSFIPSTLVLLLLARHGSGAMAFAWSRVAGQLTSCIVILVATRKFYRPGLSRYGLFIIYKFGLPLVLANFVGYLLQNVDYALIGRLLGAVMLGTYVMAFNAASWSSTLLIGALSAVGISAFSRVRHDPEQLARAMANGVRSVVLIAAPMGALEMILARPLVVVLYGSRWMAAAAPLSILTLYGFISIVCLLFAQMLAALGKSAFVLVVQAAWMIALVPAMAIGVHTHGIVGASVAHICVIVPIVLPLYLYALKRATQVQVRLLAAAALPPLIAAAIAGAVAWLIMSLLPTPLLQLLAGGTAGGLTYLMLAGPQVIGVLGRGKIRNRMLLRFVRAYYDVGRSLCLPVGPPPRHARRRRLFVRQGRPARRRSQVNPCAELCVSVRTLREPEVADDW